MKSFRTDGGPGNYVRTRYRGKLFQFAENRRPAYWGTWRKRSKSISGRNPFKCDTVSTSEKKSLQQFTDELAFFKY